MATDDTALSSSAFGYMSILEHPVQGFFGGYLIVCAAGRPREFHCSAPVKPSRAQEILYGPTLRPYLLGQQIAGQLLAGAKAHPQLILTDEPDILVARNADDFPWALITTAVQSDESQPAPFDSPRHFNFAGYHFELPVGSQYETDVVRSRLAELSRGVDLAEPLERIQLAILEAQRIGDDELDPAAHAA